MSDRQPPRQRLEAQRDALDARLLTLSEPAPDDDYTRHPVIAERRTAIEASMGRREAQRSRGKPPVHEGGETHWQYLERLHAETQDAKRAKAWLERAKGHTLRAREHIERRIGRMANGNRG